MKITLREIFLLVLVCAMGVAWYLDRTALSAMKKYADLFKAGIPVQITKQNDGSIVKEYIIMVTEPTPDKKPSAPLDEHETQTN